MKMNRWLNRFFNYLRHNPGSGFVLAFMFLLTVCIFLLILKQEKIAAGLANWAYLSLVIGLGIKFVRFIRERE